MKETEKCQQCNDDYIPKRRGVQKFCSNSCRSRYWLLQQEGKKKEKIEKSAKSNNSFNKENDKKLSEINKNVKSLKNKKPKEKVTLAGTIESFLGTSLANFASHLLTDPASKGDINELKSLIKGARYFPVKNMHPNQYNEYPFYDIETGNIEYFILE